MSVSSTTKGRESRNRARASGLGVLSTGFFIVMPLLLIGLLIRQIFLVLQDLLLPVVNAMPGVLFRRPSVRFLFVCLAIILLFCLVGLLVRTRVGKAIGRRVESACRSHVPLYSVLRNLAASLDSRGDARTLGPALITVDCPGLTQLGFIVERHADGGATVFLPASPNPVSGTVVVVEKERIRELEVPMGAVLKCMGQWGDGAAALLERSREGKNGAAAQGGRDLPAEAGAVGSKR